MSEEYVWEDRKITDIAFLGVLGCYIIIVSGVLIHLMFNFNIYRFLNGYDYCGNVCGRPNSFVEDIECSGKNMTEYPYTLDNKKKKTCVKDCGEDYMNVYHRCIKESRLIMTNINFDSMIGDLSRYWVEILGLWLLSLVLSGGIACFLRYAIKYVVWGILITVLVIVPTCGAIVAFSYLDMRVLGIICAAIAMVSIVVIILLKNRINFGISLVEEAAKAISDIPLLFFLPVLTLIFIGINLLITSFIFVVILFSGSLRKVSNDFYDYELSDENITAFCLMAFLSVWMFLFVTDCQNMIISGALARWYFSRDKTELYNLIQKSFRTTVCYHLGTVAIGSLLINLFVFLRYIIEKITRRTVSVVSSKLATIINSIVECLEWLLKYITRNCYVFTSVYGYSFCEAAKSSFYLIKNNIFNIMVIQTLSRIVFIMVKLFFMVVMISIACILFKDAHSLAPHVFILLLCLATSHIFLTIYEVAVETILVCFCIDYEENDEPYMSDELYEALEAMNDFIDKRRGHNQ